VGEVLKGFRFRDQKHRKGGRIGMFKKLKHRNLGKIRISQPLKVWGHEEKKKMTEVRE